MGSADKMKKVFGREKFCSNGQLFQSIWRELSDFRAKTINNWTYSSSLSFKSHNIVLYYAQTLYSSSTYFVHFNFQIENCSTYFPTLKIESF